MQLADPIPEENEEPTPHMTQLEHFIEAENWVFAYNSMEADGKSSQIGTNMLIKAQVHATLATVQFPDRSIDDITTDEWELRP